MSKTEAQYPMSVVTRRTGLRADVIRSWERRHRAIEPARTPGNHRLYSEEDLRRLLLIRRALDGGWHIGQVASLSNAEIRKLVEDGAGQPAPRPGPPGRNRRVQEILRRCLEHIEQLHGEKLAHELEKASVELGRVQLFDDLLVPLMERVGRSCATGRLRVAHEHVASAVVRSFLGAMRAAYPPRENAPVVVVTTPAFQHHELAAMLVAATARSEGWRADYLGPNLPAEEIAAAVARPGVRVLALSITFDENDPSVDAELRKIGRLVPDDLRIVVGGRAASGYLGALDEIGAEHIPDLRGFREFLQDQRGGA